MPKPLISVITIARNEEKVIEQTLRSVACQTFKDFEYIIIDGASTDGTVSVAKRYCSPLTRLISEKDSGIANAMNKGIMLSSGEVIVHLNAGDEFADADVLQKIADSYLELKWPWAIGSVYLVNPATGRVCQIVKIRGFDYEVLQWMNTVPHQSALVTRRLFEDYGLFDETFKIAMDYEFWLRIGHFVKPYILPFVVSNMRMGGVSSNFLKGYLEFCRARNKNQHQHRRWAFVLDLGQLVYCWIAQLAQNYLPKGLYELLQRQIHRLLPERKQRVNSKNRIFVREDIGKVEKE